MTEAHLTPNHPPPPTAHGQQHSAERDDLLILPPFSTYSTDLLIESLLHKVGHEIIQHRIQFQAAVHKKNTTLLGILGLQIPFQGNGKLLATLIA